jgi:hypothetical protein
MAMPDWEVAVGVGVLAGVRVGVHVGARVGVDVGLGVDVGFGRPASWESFTRNAPLAETAEFVPPAVAAVATLESVRPATRTAVRNASARGRMVWYSSSGKDFPVGMLWLP